MPTVFYSVDVYARTSRLDDQTSLVVIDWAPAAAEASRRQLNLLVRHAAEANRAMRSDLREYSLRAFRVDDFGERTAHLPVWTWRYQPDAGELERDGWWQL